MLVIDTMDLGSPTVRVICNPGDAVKINLTVPSGSETGTWSGFVFTDERRLMTPTPPEFGHNVVGQTVEWTLTGVQTAALIPVNKARFSGYFALRHVESARTWLDGPFIVSAGYEQ